MRRLVSILVFLFLDWSTVFATSIVAVRNNDEIVIGSDSKTTLTPAGIGVGGQGNISKCKIVQAGNLFFASAGSAGTGTVGLRGDVDPEYDLKEIIAEELRGNGRISDKVSSLEKVLAANLIMIAEEARRDNAAFFLARFARYPVHTFIVGGLDEGELVLMVRTFRLMISPSGSLSFEIGRFTCPGDCQQTGITILEGQTEAIRKYLLQHTLYLYYADPVTAVRDLVGLEIAEAPSSVGPPIDILRLTKKGAEWIQRKPLCPDIQKNPLLPSFPPSR